MRALRPATASAAAALLLLVLLAALRPASTSASAPAPRRPLPEGAERALLSALGLRARPRPDRSRAVVPPAMLELWAARFRAQQQAAARPRAARPPPPPPHGANTVRSFTHQESEQEEQEAASEAWRARLRFDVASIPASEQLLAAELQLSRGAAAPGVGRLRVLVHDVLRPGAGGGPPLTRLVDSRVVRAGRNATLVLDALPAVLRWREQPRRNHGLLVEVLAADRYGAAAPADATRHVRLRRDAAHDGGADWAASRPVLLAYTDDRRGPRRPPPRAKRSGAPAPGRKAKRKEPRATCRRHQLYVDFREVGWDDWIVAPPGYEAWYCHGDCPFPLSAHMNSTNHAVVQTLINSMNPGLVPKACCVPTQLTSISMLYLDEESKVVLKNYHEMAVVGCGCR